MAVVEYEVALGRDADVKREAIRFFYRINRIGTTDEHG